ncbi:hypothetical protein BDF20DRAFT_911553 [Mycotypha africana]|uniref:uncharacterized protein n=1 Tax=Mycotypha africana TaxID=64632 RepID=UPI002301B574|nr:uncharacterized protein BDF20DRAFT_911553 [Mycotypha africana]KAI8984457.1 hypothetical protein BDF20DRAFT_911553 [Mycotypha africana]
MRKAIPSSSKLKKGFTHSDKHTRTTTNIYTDSSNNSSSIDDTNKNNTTVGLDIPIAPSTSTYTLSGKDDKNEKLKKKTKNFLDEKQKAKTRAQSLWSYIDATNTFDQAKFFQEHAEQVFQVVFEACMHQIEKIKHKSERPQSWNSKDLVNLQKNLLLLRKIFLYIPELMRNGWQRQNIAIILTHLLDHGNHPRLRALGFQLLLLWLNDQVVEYPECIDLFANAISLDLFVLDKIQANSSTSSASATSSTTTINTPTSTATAALNTAQNIPNATTTATKSNETEDIGSVPPHHAPPTTTTSKLQATGLHFVKKLRESHGSDKQHVNHGLQRDDRIKSSSIDLQQKLILGDDAPPLYPNPVQPTFTDSILLIHIFIMNLVRLAYVAAGSPPPPDEYDYPPGDRIEPDDGIATGVGIDAATASAKFLFKIFRTYYLTKFVPSISKSLHIEGTSDTTKVFGFPSCPTSILRSILRFLIGYCLDNSNQFTHTQWQQQHHSHMSGIAPCSSPATPILKSIVLSSYETREILHEIIRQSLILPCTNPQYRDITRGAIHILGIWILGNEEDRPLFLRKAAGSSSDKCAAISISSASETAATTINDSESKQTDPIAITTKDNNNCTDTNTFLRRYMLMIKLIFEDRSGKNSRDMTAADMQQVTDWDGLVALYKDAIGIYRAIAVSKGGIDIEWESWELMLQCLMDIQQWFMSRPEKYSRIPVQVLAEDFADYLWETLLHAFIRANIVHMELWHDLKTHLVSSMRWVQALNQWVRVMQKLTRLLSSRLYKVEYDLVPETKYRFVEEFQPSSTSQTMDINTSSSSSSNRYSYFGGTNNIHIPAAATGGGNSARSSITGKSKRSRHLSMQSNPRHGGGNSKRVSANRPLSTGGSEGQLLDTKHHEKQYYDTLSNNYEQQQQQQLQQPPAPEGSVSTLLRNLSSASLQDIANTFKSERKSTNLTAVMDEDMIEEMDETSTTAATVPNSTLKSSAGSNSKFGIKITMPVTTFSSAPSQGSSVQSTNNASTFGATLMKKANAGHGVQINSSKQGVKDADKKLVPEWDLSSGSSVEGSSIKSNRTSLSSAWPTSESISVLLHPASVTEKLPSGLGSFRSSEFLALSNLPYKGEEVLVLWKNMLLSVGNINEIEGPQNHRIAMKCVVDIWDTLQTVRSQQPYCGIPIPPMYEVVPWLIQASDLPSSFDTGKADAYGSLCRIMARKPEIKVSDAYYAAFYNIILKGLSSNNNTIIQAILLNCDNLFGASLPGVHILIPSFIDTIEKQLLGANEQRLALYCNVKKSCICILGSLISISNRLKDLVLPLEDINIPWFDALQERKQFCFADVKFWLKNVLIRLLDNNTTVLSHIEEETELHCMVIDNLCVLALDELMSNETPQYETIHECVVSLVNQLYWCSIPIVNNVADCLITMAHIYKEELDIDGIIVQEILTHIIDSLNVHLNKYETTTPNGRGFIISKLFSCLLEWIMAINPAIFSETDLCQLVFDVIEYALRVDSESKGQQEKTTPQSPHFQKQHHPQQPSSPGKKKELSTLKFKLVLDKRPPLQSDKVDQLSTNCNNNMNENDSGYVKESAEAVLLHLLHHFNNFAPPYGPATIHSTILGPGVSQDDMDYRHYQYFSFNDSTIIAFAEVPKLGETKKTHARMIIRDLTGRYVWDAQLEPGYDEPETATAMAEVLMNDEAQRFTLREDITVQKQQAATTENTTFPALTEKDPVAELLQQIGEKHPDCLTAMGTPLSTPSTLTSFQSDMVGDMGKQLDEYLANEAESNQQYETDIQAWYSMMNMLRKKGMSSKQPTEKREDTMQVQLINNFSLKKNFLPAFPQEPEQLHVPFQQCRLLMSHLGFIHYNHLKNGSFQMLNKSPGLYRDLRGLDRKHGRETMKIALIYVAAGQEDERSILQNNQGSEKYDKFVSSLGWDIDIASHTGYLGGLERNATNGSRASYYCSATLEIIYHDVTKMPTDPSDPKQLKKKRHIGNDHVHIVWNEHNRDYRVDTIGGDFGNAQIIITPLPNDMYRIQVYRDAKIPYFGLLFNKMVVSGSILGPLVRSTAINAFRASVHTNLYSFYKCVYAQRANDVKTITNRHRISNWGYEQFMERIFMPEEQTSKT